MMIFILQWMPNRLVKDNRFICVSYPKSTVPKVMSKGEVRPYSIGLKNVNLQANKVFKKTYEAY
ncbi:MAG: hypothetical protein EOM31_02860 [Bacteroidia bacterium]|nr:hypothetical protein [Bacteroidia bacterium]